MERNQDSRSPFSPAPKFLFDLGIPFSLLAAFPPRKPFPELKRQSPEAHKRTDLPEEFDSPTPHPQTKPTQISILRNRLWMRTAFRNQYAARKAVSLIPTYRLNSERANRRLCEIPLSLSKGFDFTNAIDTTLALKSQFLYAVTDRSARVLCNWALCAEGLVGEDYRKPFTHNRI